jgi:hypothetical protein
MTSINYRYFVHAKWAETSSETPAAIGATFLKTLDALSGVDPLFAGWQVFRNLQIAEDEQPRQVPLDAARKRITEIVESGVARNDYDEPEPIYGYSAVATAGVRGPRYVTLSVHTTLNPDVGLKFGEHNIASDLSIVTYPLFKAALLAISTVGAVQWSYAQAYRNNVVEVPMDLAPGVPAFRIDTAAQVPLDPTFPDSIFHVPWIVYLSAERAAGVTLAREVLTEHMPDSGLLMSAATERLDPMNPKHVRRARILAETLIACTGVTS